ncbi:MAG: hypothetical protein NZ455_05380 [Bacteroidia bacterium]|nr:hypothetical protein [Bacteroidia bacterium]MDW8345430.1 hypothetical protein [Bacteroidia bacterium]
MTSIVRKTELVDILAFNDFGWGMSLWVFHFADARRDTSKSEIIFRLDVKTSPIF